MPQFFECLELLHFGWQGGDPTQPALGVDGLLLSREAQQAVEYRLRKAGDVHQLGHPGTGQASQGGDLGLAPDNPVIEHAPELEGCP
jgi:hypothetical protein